MWGSWNPPNYGKWMILDPMTDTVVAGRAATGRAEFSLDDVEAWLNEEDR
jgi:hypothetical protein